MVKQDSEEKKTEDKKSEQEEPESTSGMFYDPSNEPQGFVKTMAETAMPYPGGSADWRLAISQATDEFKNKKIGIDEISDRAVHIMSEKFDEFQIELKKQYFNGLVAGIMLAIIASFTIAALFKVIETCMNWWYYLLFLFVGLGGIVYVVWFLNQKIKMVENKE